ncbi:conserved hypothetical protein [Perkinsus marinus ATCC 50983]|uniref:WW domain-containing protein n=1 Tax=Perkinsus marinus (strain ATCC 50983 / TXsc) TaxID=423536 RepID=C5KG94_PERM5|nr:conserved hypothetical protein [Perkinsus marinus ATCC 50983]EER16450.1 conserved hypothetical protein [Perkinsus marinus ATCC 50983]|eukprot:XP_002784654.1 conserved hypothetical protein [Perkinsus marinus ATCC 50983]
MATAVSAATKVPTSALGKIVGVSGGKTQQVPEEPTDQEIEDYALWLGLDNVKDRDLFWIARQALRTPIPHPWVQCQTASGDVFFHNTKTKESVWDHPYDQYYQQAVEQYKRGKISRGELSASVSQSWLFSTTDQRSSAQVSPEVAKGQKESSTVHSAADNSPSRIVPDDIELPDERVVEAVGPMPSSILVTDRVAEDELAEDAPVGVDDMLEGASPNEPDSADADAIEVSSAKELFEPPPRSIEAAYAELAELRSRIVEMEREKERAENDLRDSEIHREAMQKDHDAAAEALRLAEEARDAAVAELEEAKEELMREKEVVKRWHAGFPDIRAREKAETEFNAQEDSNKIIVEELTEQLGETQSKSEYLDGVIATQTSEIEMLRERLKDGREKVLVLAEEDAAQRKLLVEKDMEVVNLNRALASMRQQMHVESRRSTFSKLCGRAPRNVGDTVLHEDLSASVDAPEQNELFDQLLNGVLALPLRIADESKN